GDQVVAVGVVTVVVGVDQRRHGSRRRRRDGPEQYAGTPFGGTGVDEHGVVAGGDEPAVVDVPGAIGLDVAVSALGEGLDGRRGRGAIDHAANYAPKRRHPVGRMAADLLVQ